MFTDYYYYNISAVSIIVFFVLRSSLICVRSKIKLMCQMFSFLHVLYNSYILASCYSIAYILSALKYRQPIALPVYLITNLNKAIINLLKYNRNMPN